MPGWWVVREGGGGGDCTSFVQCLLDVFQQSFAPPRHDGLCLYSLTVVGGAAAPFDPIAAVVAAIGYAAKVPLDLISAWMEFIQLRLAQERLAPDDRPPVMIGPGRDRIRRPLPPAAAQRGARVGGEDGGEMAWWWRG